MNGKLWHEITYPFQQAALNLRIDKQFNPHFDMDLIAYPFWVSLYSQAAISNRHQKV